MTNTVTTILTNFIPVTNIIQIAQFGVVSNLTEISSNNALFSNIGAWAGLIGGLTGITALIIEITIKFRDKINLSIAVHPEIKIQGDNELKEMNTNVALSISNFGFHAIYITDIFIECNIGEKKLKKSKQLMEKLFVSAFIKNTDVSGLNKTANKLSIKLNSGEIIQLNIDADKLLEEIEFTSATDLYFILKFQGTKARSLNSEFISLSKIEEIHMQSENIKHSLKKGGSWTLS